MSLETKIEKLTEAVELLTRAILERDIVELAQNIVEPTVEVTKEAVAESVKKSKPKKAAEPVKEKADAPEQVTAEEVQSMCLALVREDGSKKKHIVDIFAEYGAKTVGQIKADKLAEVKTKLEAL